MNLDPALIAFGARLERGALMRLGPPAAATGGTGGGAGGAGGTGGGAAGGGAGDPLTGDVMYFQFNPDTITRTRTGKWEPRKKRKGFTVEAPAQVRQRGGQGSSALLAESETVSFKVLFDATEAILDSREEAAENGVLPQLAFLEVLSTGKEGVAKDKGARRETIQPVRPDELLLILGTKRLFPVVLTSLTITEQKFLPTLVPIRAEADLKFTVLEPDEAAYRAWIGTAWKRLLTGRIDASQRAVAPGDVAAAIGKELTKDPFGPAGAGPAAGGAPGGTFA